MAKRGIHLEMARKVASWQARLPSPAITRILHRLWPSRRCSPSPEQEPRHTAGPPDTRARGEVRSRAAGRTWADAHAEGGISPRTSPRVTGLRGGCPIKISVLLKLVCPIRLAGVICIRATMGHCGLKNSPTSGPKVCDKPCRIEKCTATSNLSLSRTAIGGDKKKKDPRNSEGRIRIPCGTLRHLPPRVIAPY